MFAVNLISIHFLPKATADKEIEALETKEFLDVACFRHVLQTLLRHKLIRLISID